MKSTEFNFPDKAEIRRELRARLKENHPCGSSMVSAELLAHLSSTEAFARASSLVAYISFREEPDLKPLLERWLDTGKPLLLPRYIAAEDVYELTAVRDLSRDLQAGKFGVLEPKPSLPAAPTAAVDESALWLIPGLAFTADGARLGRGRGYYDRLLARYPAGWRIGVAWSEQILPSLPVTGLDVPMNQVVTPACVFHINVRNAH